MSKYTVKFYSGEYISRQRLANKDMAICYIEHHFNAFSEGATGTEVVVASNAGRKSKAWAVDYAQRVSSKLGVPLRSPETKGVIVGGRDGRGNGNLLATNMPAILVEPAFVSNPKEVLLIKSDKGQAALVDSIVESIQKIFPEGGLVAFSVGHKGKTSNPTDRGADVYGGGAEADLAEAILIKAKAKLEKL